MRSVNLDTLVFTIFGSLKVIGLMAAISAILVLNWLITKKFFLFRSTCRNYFYLLVYGVIVAILAVLAPFVGMCYLIIWGTAPEPPTPLFLFAIQVSWMIPALAMCVRNSKKYWKNRISRVHCQVRRQDAG